jgi:hypothetical protein
VPGWGYTGQRNWLTVLFVNRPVASTLVFLLSIASPIHGVSGQSAPTNEATKAPKSGTPKPDSSKPSSTKKDAPKKIDSVKRLQPSEVATQIPGLPPEFVQKLNRRGCSIPQLDEGPDVQTSESKATEPTNVIEGEFAKKGQKDWAALCSNGKTSTIVIFWSKPTSCASQLARLDDPHFMQLGADKKMHYSRSITASDPSRDASQHRGPKQMSHQGIYDAFVGKASSLFYCNEGKWRIFPGAD